LATETATIVFTDLVGSTQLLSRVGEERAEELRREHFGMLREVLATHGGREIKNVGDGLMLVFSAPSVALDVVVAVQQGLEARNRGAAEALQVRVGLSMGECDVDAGDYFGRPVVEAARLCARAEGGQVLATELVRLLAGSRGGHDFGPLGEMELKGLDAPVAVCEVRWTPLEVDDRAVTVPLAPRLGRAPGAVFVGRTAEQALILDALKDTSTTGRRHVVLVSGEPGIGKTTLLAEAAATAHDQDVLVLYGRCDEDLAVPYQPWREALTQLAQHAPQLVDPFRGALGPLVGTDHGIALGDDPEAERYLLYAGLVDLFAQASQSAPIMLVLDDLHWADGPTIALLRHLAGSDAPLRLLLVGTFRDADLGASHPLTDALAALHRETGVDRIGLRGLGDIDVLAMLETLAGHEMDESGLALRDALLAETDGNPFFTVEILRHLADTGQIYQEQGGRWIASTDLRTHGLPVSVREVVAQRVARLGDDTRRALGYASVIGRDFDLDVLADVMDVDADTLLDLVEPAIEHAVVADVAPGRFTFTHALVEHTLYDELSPTRRSRAHRLVAAALEVRLGDDPGPRAGELAHHWAAATTPTDTHKAIKYAVRAGDYALAQIAPDEAFRWYGRALELLDLNPSAEEHARAAVLTGLGDAQRQLGDPAYRETLLEAGRLARRLNDTDLLVRAALATNRGFASAAGTVATDVVELVQAALDAIGTELSSRRAKLLAILSSELVYGDPSRACEIARDALRVAEQVGDDATFVWTAVRAGMALRTPDTIDEQLQLGAQVTEVIERLADPVLRWYIAATFPNVHIEQGELDAADRLFGISDELAAMVNQPYMRWVSTFERGTRELLAGDCDAAEVSATAAFELGANSGQPDALMIYGAQLMVIRLAQGREAEIVDLLAQAAVDNPGLPVLRAGLGRYYASLGRRAEALEVFAPDLADGFSSYPFDNTWTTSMHFCAETISDLQLPEPAEQLYARITPYAHLIPNATVSVYEVLHFALGRLATVLERYDDAESHFRAAHDLHERMNALYLLAHTRAAWAEMLSRRNVGDDAARARVLAQQALSVATTRGYRRVESDATRLLQRLT
jgi:class 3 adenylate cyclase/tetratricopeptide (TPR) repeat protein